MESIVHGGKRSMYVVYIMVYKFPSYGGSTRLYTIRDNVYTLYHRVCETAEVIRLDTRPFRCMVRATGPYARGWKLPATRIFAGFSS
jgi:hypothetical protein